MNPLPSVLCPMREPFPYFDGVHRSDEPGIIGQFVKKRDHRFLVRDRDVQASETERDDRSDRRAEILGRTANGT